MGDKPWKVFEREVGALLNGKRFWANSGESIDVESDTAVAQCKHVASMSLNALAELAETAERQGRGKLKAGLVCVKTRPGAGRKATTLVVMTADVWKYLHGPSTDATR